MKRVSIVLLLLLLVQATNVAATPIGQPTYYQPSDAPALVVPYTPTAMQRSTAFSVTVNGQHVPVAHYNTVSYIHFAFAGTAQVVIRTKEPVVSYTLSPKRYEIGTRWQEKTVSFVLTVPRKLVLHTGNGSAGAAAPEKLIIFADPLEEAPPRPGMPGVVNLADYGVDNTGSVNVTAQLQQAIDEAASRQGVLYIPPGMYQTKELHLHSNMTLYLAAGAVLKGTYEINPSFGGGVLNLVDVENVRISGRGVIDGSGSYWRPRGGWYSMIVVSNARNVTLEGIVLRDSAVANVWIEYAEQVEVYNLKVLADAAYINTDGFAFWSSRHILVDDVFYLGTDDATTHGGNKSGEIQNNENITVRNAVFYTGGGFKIGTTTLQDTIRAITYENIDIVFANDLAGLWPVTGANFEQIYFKQIYVEDMLDAPDPQEYKGARLFEWRIIVASWEETSSPETLGYIRDVVFANLVIDDLGGQRSLMAGYDAARNIQVVFDNMVVQGQQVSTPDAAGIDVLNEFVELTFTSSNPTVVNITAPRLSVARNGLPGQFLVTRTGDTSQPLTVPYQIRGTATNGVDYQALSGQITIPAGAAAAPIPIQALAGAGSPPLETILLRLENQPVSTAYLLGVDFQAALTLN